MKLPLKALCWVTIPTTSLTLVLLALTTKAPIQIKAIAEQLNQNFHWGIWTDVPQIQSACVLVLAVMLPILLLTVIGLKGSNSKLSKDVMTSKEVTEAALASIGKQLTRFSELLGPILRRVGSMEEDDLKHGVPHLMGKLDELSASRTTQEAAIAAKLEETKSKLALAAKMLDEITKSDAARKLEILKLLESKNTLRACLGELDIAKILTSVKAVEDDVKNLNGELETLNGLSSRIEGLKATLATIQTAAKAHADEKTGIDAKIAEAVALVEVIQEALDSIEKENFDETDREVSEIEDDSSDLEDRVRELGELMERLKTAKEELKNTLAELQKVLGAETTNTTGS